MIVLRHTFPHSLAMTDNVRFYRDELLWAPKYPSKRLYRQARRNSSLKRPKNLLREFLECTSIHGLGHFANDQHLIESVLWGVVMTAAILGTVIMGQQAWHRYRYYPTVISMEKDYKNWNTTFAMASLCPDEKVDVEKLTDIADRYSVRDVQGFTEFFTALADATYDTFHTIPDFKEIGSDDFLKIILEARFNFSFTPSNSQGMDQDPILMVTENNVCFGFNTDIGHHFSPENFSKKNRFGPRNSTLITGNALDGEVFLQVMNMSSGYKVKLTGPYDMPDVSIRNFISEIRYYLFLELEALSIISRENIRSLSPEQRKCRFYDESNLDISEIYSYNLCRMQCRADLAFKLCNCIPYFYKKLKNRPYCDAAGMRCLSKHSKFLTNLREPDTEKKIPCGCLPLCNDVQFIIALETHAVWPATNLKFSMVQYPRLRLKREIIFGFSDLLVSIGGTAGLLLGCSVLSFIEIFYYISFRLFLYLKNEFRASRKIAKKLPNPRIKLDFN